MIKYDHLAVENTVTQLIQIDGQWYACFDYDAEYDVYRTCLKIESPDTFTLIPQYEGGPWTEEKFDEYGGPRPDDDSPIGFEIVKNEEREA